MILNSIEADWRPTLHYGAIFIIGIMLALHRAYIISILRNSNRSMVCLLIGLLFVFSGAPINLVLHNSLGGFINDWAVGIGSAMIMIIAISDESVIRKLSHPWLLFLGDISYSLYLLHTIILLTVIHVFGNYLPHALSIFIAFTLTVPGAYISYRFIEIPSIQFGRLVGKKFGNDRNHGQVHKR